MSVWPEEGLLSAEREQAVVVDDKQATNNETTFSDLGQIWTMISMDFACAITGVVGTKLFQDGNTNDLL